MKDLKTQAYQMGQQAKKDGYTGIPALHQEVMSFAYANSAHMVMIMKEFTRGWTIEHLKSA